MKCDGNRDAMRHGEHSRRGFDRITGFTGWVFNSVDPGIPSKLSFDTPDKMRLMEPAAIRTDALSRTYKKPRQRRWWGKRVATEGTADFVALDNVTLEVRPGELFGLLGPNGAGKTTLIKILTTLLAPSAGSAWVDGLDVVTEAEEIRPRINMVSGGESSGYGILNVRENLWLFARIYGVPTSVAHERIDKMLGVVGLDRQGQEPHQPPLDRPAAEDELLPRLHHRSRRSSSWMSRRSAST